jgi:aryl-alcohol dehydrogenase-like predicted oxidoreductase
MMRAGNSTRSVGETSVEITPLCFGCARLFSGNSTKASAKLIEAALRAGIRHFDTAPSYASEQSERVLGEVLAGVEDVTIATKFGLPYSVTAETGAMSLYRKALRPVLARTPRLKSGVLRVFQGIRKSTATPPERMVRKLSRDDIRRSFEGSVTRLKRDHIDIYLAHEPDQILINDDLAEILTDLQNSGGIGAFGRAWDRSVPAMEPFGQVIQSRFDPAAMPDKGHFRIFHGVLRHRHEGIGDGERRASAPKRLAAAMAQHPSSAVLFSASHPSQIDQITSGLPVFTAHAGLDQCDLKVPPS